MMQKRDFVADEMHTAPAFRHGLETQVPKTGFHRRIRHFISISGISSYYIAFLEVSCYNNIVDFTFRYKTSHYISYRGISHHC